MDNIFYNRAGGQIIKPEDRDVEDRLAVYGLLIKDKDNELLLIQPLHSDNWELPGGKVDDGESEDEALKREIPEEVGFNVGKIGKCIFTRQQNYYADNVDQFFNSNQKFYIIEEFEKDENISLDNSEVRNTKWFSIDDNLKNVVRKNQLEVIQKIERD